ncbi:hypothetical protein HZH66_013609 [Vespula vulgaris]|uniref:Uncharacterized protein n=1 Tax=Vespula vulgaris TaxID=7454 RepID=A0A834J647_VESVU|nr:hypothetical protein HZH66_013609 [Vespula vulgaris]
MVGEYPGEGGGKCGRSKGAADWDFYEAPSKCASENGLERACDAYQSEKKLAKGKKKEIDVSGTGRVECSQPRLPTFINLYQLPSARFVLSPDNMPRAL